MDLMPTYTVTVTREDGWWMVAVPELDLLTQARKYSEVERMARSVIAMSRDIPHDSFSLDITVPEVAEAITAMRVAEEAAESARLLAAAARRVAAQRAYETTASYREAGALIGLTHQRVEQLVKESAHA